MLCTYYGTNGRKSNGGEKEGEPDVDRLCQRLQVRERRRSRAEVVSFCVRDVERNSAFI